MSKFDEDFNIGFVAGSLLTIFAIFLFELLKRVL